MRIGFDFCIRFSYWYWFQIDYAIQLLANSELKLTLTVYAIISLAIYEYYEYHIIKSSLVIEKQVDKNLRSKSNWSGWSSHLMVDHLFDLSICYVLTWNNQQHYA